MPQGYWWTYLFQTAALIICTCLCLAGSSIFAKASNALLVVLTLSIISIPFSALFLPSFTDPAKGIEFTGMSLATLRSNLLPHASGESFAGFETLRDLFGILFPATSGIFAGASMSGDLRNPSKDIPVGTLWAMLSTFVAYLLVILSLASSTTHASFLRNGNVIQDTNIWPPIIFAGEFATTFFSALMGVIGSAKLMQALARDKLFPGLSVFGKGTKKADEPLLAIFLTYIVAQFAMFANLNQIATFISMGYQVSRSFPKTHVCVPSNFQTDDFFCHEPGLLPPQDWIRSKLQTRIQIFQLADCIRRQCSLSGSHVLHR